MTGIATTICLVFALSTALAAGVRAVRDQAITRVELAAAAAVELAVLFYLVVRVADLIGGHRSSGLGLVIAYLIGLALTMPVTTVLSLAETTRWGSVVLVVGALVVCVLLARVDQLWSPNG